MLEKRMQNIGTFDGETKRSQANSFLCFLLLNFLANTCKIVWSLMDLCSLIAYELQSLMSKLCFAAGSPRYVWLPCKPKILCYLMLMWICLVILYCFRCSCNDVLCELWLLRLWLRFAWVRYMTTAHVAI